jgi:hypothetical protein
MWNLLCCEDFRIQSDSVLEVFVDAAGVEPATLRV